jgi:tetraacyldisaccharide 4'-kinase
MHLEPRRFLSCVNKDKTLGIDAFTGRTVHALAGIGNPNRFFRTLEKSAGVDVIAHPMRDHQSYTEQDIYFQDGNPVLMTEKDAVKIKEIAGDEHWYLEVSAALPDNFTSQLREKLEFVKEQKGNSNNG